MRAQGEVKGHVLIDFIRRNFVNKDISVITQLFSNKMWFSFLHFTFKKYHSHVEIMAKLAQIYRKTDTDPTTFINIMWRYELKQLRQRNRAEKANKHNTWNIWNNIATAIKFEKFLAPSSSSQWLWNPTWRLSSCLCPVYAQPDHGVSCCRQRIDCSCKTFLAKIIYLSLRLP